MYLCVIGKGGQTENIVCCRTPYPTAFILKSRTNNELSTNKAGQCCDAMKQWVNVRTIMGREARKSAHGSIHASRLNNASTQQMKMQYQPARNSSQGAEKKPLKMHIMTRNNYQSLSQVTATSMQGPDGKRGRYAETMVLWNARLVCTATQQRGSRAANGGKLGNSRESKRRRDLWQAAMSLSICSARCDRPTASSSTTW
jgi:hypothetical protein